MDRDKKIRVIKQGINFAKKHIDESNFSGAVVVSMAVIEQMLALIEGEDLNNVSNPDVCIHFEEDCCQGGEE